MTVELVKEISAEVLKTILLAAGPAMIVALVVGLLVSFVQAITQIQEFTLTFVPKIIAVFICIFVSLPWVSKVLVTFTVKLIENIPGYLR